MNFLKRVYNDIRRAIKPTKEEVIASESKQLVSVISSRFSIEEQSQIILSMKQDLILQRENEIKDARDYVERLENDYKKLFNTQVKFELD